MLSALRLVKAGIELEALLDRGEQHFLFLVGRFFEEGDIAALGAQAEMDQQGGVAAVVQNHVRRAAVGPFEDAMGIIPIVLQALALAREHRRAGGGDRGGGVVLRRIDVARGPANVGAERLQGLDQHGGLNGHVQGAGDAGALERLARAIFGARRHQARHFRLGDGDFLIAPFGEADVGDDIIVEMSGHGFPLARGADDAGLGAGSRHVVAGAYSKGFRATQ